jgi:ABC-type multidrug transport system fused ATPase/permease subunit
LKLRRTLLGVLYDKISRLSVNSLTQTNSGKLISLISADLFQIERQLGWVVMLAAAPFVNILAWYIIY